MAPHLRTQPHIMKIRRLDSSPDEPERTARVLRDQDRRCFLLIGREVVRANDHALSRFEVTAVTDAERHALLGARTRLRGLRRGTLAPGGLLAACR
jgi:hypothetical protein